MKKIYARTNERSYLNNFNGEDWQEVEEVRRHYPSGFRKCYKFADGFICKADRCEVYCEEK